MIFPPILVLVPCCLGKRGPSPTSRLRPLPAWPDFWWNNWGNPATLEDLQEQVGAEDQGLLLTQLFQLQLDGAVCSLAGLRWVRIR